MQSRDLMQILLQDKEHGVKQVYKLGHGVQPSDVHEEQPFLVLVTVVLTQWITLPGLDPESGSARHDVEEVGIDGHHHDVVGQYDGLQVERCSVLHQVGTQDLDEVNVSCDDPNHVPGPSFHQRVLTDPGITCNLPDIEVVVLEVGGDRVRTRHDGRVVVFHV